MHSVNTGINVNRKIIYWKKWWSLCNAAVLLQLIILLISTIMYSEYLVSKFFKVYLIIKTDL